MTQSTPSRKGTSVQIASQPGLDELQVVLDQAAAAAARMVPTVEARRMALLGDLQTVEATLAKLRNVIAAGSGATSSPVAEPQYPEGKPDALAGPDIDDVLFASEVPLRVQDIIDKVKARTGREWASSTVYGHLNKGKTKSLLLNEAGTWQMTAKGRGAML
jgi:hypothetical protein